MKILYIAHRIPYPPNKGDKIRSFNEIKYLSQRHEIHLACLADDPTDLKYEDDLKTYCKTTVVVLVDVKLAKLKSSVGLFSMRPLSLSYFYSQKLQGTIDQLLSTNDYGAIFCFSSPMAEYVFRSRVFSPRSTVHGEKSNDHRPSTKLIMDFVDVDSDKWVQYSRYARFPKSWIYALEGRRLADYERKVAKVFDHSIFVTEAERRIFQNKYPDVQNISVIPNGVDLDYFSRAVSQEPASRSPLPATSNQQPAVVFTGAMDYYANIDGVVWFAEEILPLVKKEIPTIQFYIVGSNPTKKVLSLSYKNGVTVTGYVPDTREYLNRAAVVVVPLRIARGIQNKILEAMAMGIPVVATPKAFEGIEAQPGRDLILGENAEKIAAEVIQLIKKADLRRSLGDNARRIIEENYCWSKNLSQFDNILTK